jgi:RNA-splicing ligase RtcB
VIELNGKYNKTRVFTDNIDGETISQVISLLNQPFVENQQIRIMPDCHAGIGCVVGTTMTLKDKVIPYLVGSDIGCGMLVIKLKEKIIDLPKLDSVIKEFIPSGYKINKNNKETKTSLDIETLKCFNKSKINLSHAYKSVGTLGGGNHFIEIDKDEIGNLYLVIHSGSRNLGKEVAEYYQKLAYETMKQSSVKTPFEMSYVEGQIFDNYIEDMKQVQQFASDNRAEIARLILQHTKLTEIERFETIHNYIDTKNMILRKGAVSAMKGEVLIIPINMRDGSLICVGKGNKEWNYSAPHGAGRLMSRSEAKQSFSVSEYKETMQEAGIYTTSIGISTLDECPMAYKPINEIIDNIQVTVDIVKIIKPIYNFKANTEYPLKIR